jgi:hypothetical protein
MGVFAAPDVARIDLAGQPVAASARARALWSRQRGMVFTVSNLPSGFAGIFPGFDTGNEAFATVRDLIAMRRASTPLRRGTVVTRWSTTEAGAGRALA